jgi:phosphonate transport system substrate-binding protein
MKPTRPKSPWAAWLLAGLASLSWAAQGSPCDSPATLRFSLIPKKNVAEQLESYRPLLARLEAVTQRRVEVVPPSSYSSVIEGLLAGNIDVAELGPASFAIARSRDDTITPFATLAQGGGHFTRAGIQYHALLVARRSSDYRDIPSLAGRSVGLTDPASTSGAVLPGQEFAKVLGKPLVDHFSRLLYTGSHDRSIDSLLKGHVDAAFISSLRLDEYIRRGKLRPDDLVVLWKSSPIPHDPFVLRGRLCGPLQAAIRQALLTDSAEVRKVMANLKAEGFHPVGDEDYSHIREIIAQKRGVGTP